MKNLVIVESPNKVQTIKKYLGKDYEVLASVGHILKMKTSGQFGLGIDFENWEPEYSLDSTKKKVVEQLKKGVKEAEHVYIATDPDREGEAIGEHLVNYLKIKDKYSRLKYNEITEEAILNALKHVGKIDEALVDAQKARRMLDRIIGFRLSYLMKNKLSNSPTNPSAGRVQSIALKLVIDRERIIQAFIPEQYSKLTAILAQNKLEAFYFNPENPSEKKDWIFKEDLDSLKTYFEKTDKKLTVSDVKSTERKVSAIQPFKQAVLYRKSPFSSAVTQIAAQKLYEGYGDGGLISYPRTDSTRLSDTFVRHGHEFIAKKWGKDYISEEIKGFSGDQNAHEAIRPTSLYLDPESAKAQFSEMTEQEYKLYKLIYETTLQALIKQPKRMSTSYTYTNGEYQFRNNFSKITYDGYYVVTGIPADDIDPRFKKGDVLDVDSFIFTDHETKPIPRYNEGTLIEALDEIKVGRPSTFATTVKILKDRQYVETKEGTLWPTEFGTIVLDKLINSFPKIINEDYTAKVEEELDQISEDKLEKNTVMEDFWKRFEESYKEASETMEKTTLKVTQLDEPCPDDSGILLERFNKKGQKFIGCKNFPNCRYTRSIEGEPQKTFKRNFYKKSSSK